MDNGTVHPGMRGVHAAGPGSALAAPRPRMVIRLDLPLVSLTLLGAVAGHATGRPGERAPGGEKCHPRQCHVVHAEA